ncbi:MAG TPA: hypothetical protein VGT79_01465, partial [Xanthomonadaceae bacterium]|nr:hypothetical protein [Xanthomonadaceae bacterium]
PAISQRNARIGRCIKNVVGCSARPVRTTASFGADQVTPAQSPTSSPDIHAHDPASIPGLARFGSNAVHCMAQTPARGVDPAASMAMMAGCVDMAAGVWVG